MVNLFRLLGLPNPNNSTRIKNSPNHGKILPDPQAGGPILHLSDNRISERTQRLTRKPSRKVIYIKPDKSHRLHLHGMGHELMNGNMILVDLEDLIHMPSQTAKCRRDIQQLAENNGLTVFALNNSDTLLMIPGTKMRVDTHKHVLGLSKLT